MPLGFFFLVRSLWLLFRPHRRPGPEGSASPSDAS
jgi:hypothetical protein